MPKGNNNTRSRREVSLAQAAQLLRRSRNSLYQALSAGMPGRSEPGARGAPEWRLDVAEVARWFEARAVEKERARLEQKHAAELERFRRALELVEGGSGEPTSRGEALRRKSVAEARLRELALREKEGELLPASATDHAIMAFASILKSRFSGLGMASAPKLAAESKPAVCRVIVDEAVEVILTDLADEAEAAQAREKKRESRARNGRATL